MVSKVSKIPARISTPRYLDPAEGKTCGNCQHCDMQDPYVPSRMALCSIYDCAVKINRDTKCLDYLAVGDE